MIQHISKYITVALLFVVCSLQAQTPANIIKEGNYTVTGTETLTAGQSITLKPNSWIKSGSTFSAMVSADAYIDIAFDNNQNYVFTRAYQTAMSSSAGISNNSDVIESITYFDGLGRLKQQIGIKATPDKNDLVTHINYDDYGRQAKQYLPFESLGAAGNYRSVNINTDINSFYLNKYSEDFTGVPIANVNAYSESIFEDSPLSRVLKQGAPGKDWKANANSNSDHTIKFDWKTNTANEVFYFWVNFHMDNTEVPILIKDGYYDADALVVTITKDENWQPNQQHPNDHTTKEYNDKLGRVILKRTYNNGVAHDTYNVYDDFGNLTYVIPPKVTLSAIDGVSPTDLSELCYQYIYDYRNRLVEKKIPGKGWEYIVYNKLDQPVMTQDANQRSKSPKEWLFTKYDAFGRVTYTGVKKSNESRIAHQNSANTTAVYSSYETKQSSSSSLAGTAIYYSNNAVPRYFDEILTINYYDDYEIGDQVTFNPADGAGTWEGMTPVANVKGLSTVSKIKVLETNKWITTATYYDDKGRPWETHVKNEYLGTEDWILNQLDFVGKVLKTRAMHIKNGVTITTEDTFAYDHMGRLLTQNQTINNQEEEQIVNNTYDELGQLENKDVGGGLQTVDYTYNIHGWLTGINDVDNIGDDLFTFKIAFNTPQYGATPQYKYNLGEVEWKTANDNIKRWYAYEYDAFERILSAKSHDGKYDVRDIAYDKMGNLENLTRNGWQNSSTYNNLDILNYEYDSGNKLLNVTDSGNTNYGFKDRNISGNDYSYDINGNLLSDKNKGITSIHYNHHNFPTRVNITNSEHNGNIQYVYDANGIKQKKTAIENGNVTTVEYSGNFVYENGSLKSITHPEGYIEKENDGSYNYIYEHRDIWKNTRITYADDNHDGAIQTTEIRREQNYYPFGMQWEGVNPTIRHAKNNLKTYQGQELTEELGLNTHEWRYRMSDRSIGRFWQVDPLAEDYMYNATYAFQENKMGIGTELEGLEVKEFKKANFFTPTYKKQGKIFSYSATFRRKLGPSINIETSAGNTKASINGTFAEGSVTVTDDKKIKGKANILKVGAGFGVEGLGESKVSLSAGQLKGSISESGTEGEASLLAVDLSATIRDGFTVSESGALISSNEDKNGKFTGSYKISNDTFSGVLSGNKIGIGVGAGPVSVAGSADVEESGNMLSNIYNKVMDLFTNGWKSTEERLND